MLTEILFMGHRDASILEPDWGTVVVSILDPTEESCRPPRLHEFRDALELSFVDVFERTGPHWPDEMTVQEHVDACTMATGRAPEIGDARSIVEFIARYAEIRDQVRLVVHCYAGVSRSAAVAKWAGMTFKAPLPQIEEGLQRLDHANPRVLRLLKRAYAMRKSRGAQVLNSEDMPSAPAKGVV